MLRVRASGETVKETMAAQQSFLSNVSSFTCAVLNGYQFFFILFTEETKKRNETKRTFTEETKR